MYGMKWQPRRIIFTSALAAALVAAGLTAAESNSADDVDQDLDSLTLELLADIEGFHDRMEEKELPDPVINTPEYPLPEQAPGDDWWSGLLKVTQTDNPLISLSCRRDAIETARRLVGDADKAHRHIRDQVIEWQRIRRGDDKIHLSEYFGHLKECKKLCGPLVGGLLRCHIEGVQRRPHMIVLFEVDHPKTQGRFRFAQRDARKLTEFARRIEERDESLLVLSRASILGPNENFVHNAELARRRALAVERALLEAGFPDQRILSKSLGWEPPRLVVEEVAAAYGLELEWRRQSNKHYIDQSVVLVAYQDPTRSGSAE